MEIPTLQITPKTFLDRSVVLYGLSETGKSTIIRDILYNLRDEIDQVVVFNGTDGLNSIYDNIAPRALIFKSLDVETLTNIWERQEMIATIYHKANDLSTLEKLFLRIPNEDLSYKYIAQKRVRAHAIKKFKKTINPAKLQDELEVFNSRYDEYMRLFMKIHINNNAEMLRHMNLDEDERYCLEYLNMNGRLLFIIDDLSEDLAALNRNRGNKILLKMYSKCRWARISMIFALHNESCLHPEIRTNAFVSFFTSAEVATKYFNNASNGLKHRMKEVKEACRVIFGETDSYEVLAYLRKTQKICRFKAQKREKFTIGSPTLYHFCNIITEDENSINRNNKFYSAFKV